MRKQLNDQGLILVYGYGMQWDLPDFSGFSYAKDGQFFLPSSKDEGGLVIPLFTNFFNPKRKRVFMRQIGSVHKVTRDDTGLKIRGYVTFGGLDQNEADVLTIFFSRRDSYGEFFPSFAVNPQPIIFDENDENRIVAGAIGGFLLVPVAEDGSPGFFSITRSKRYTGPEAQ
jgi:hypothetical protein